MTLAIGKCLPKRIRGLTLIEILISVVILSTGTVLIAQALARVAQAQAIAQRYSQAYLFLVSKTAELELASRTGEPFQEHAEGSFYVGPQAYQWEVLAQPVPDDEKSFEVSLAVHWRYANQQYAREIDTVLRAPSSQP